MPEPAPFEITPQTGGSIASNGVTALVLRGEGRVFRRRAVRPFAQEGEQHVEWAVAEMDGVRVYFDGHSVIVTKEDLRP